MQYTLCKELPHGMSRGSQNLNCPHCTYVGATSEKGLNIHIGREYKRIARQRFPHHRYTKKTSAPQSKSTALSITCPECKEGGFKSKTHLGRHRREEHHIPGREAQRALRNAKLLPRERSSADIYGSLTRTRN
jgi:hypothetical protein